jgi:hypothetical protein
MQKVLPALLPLCAAFSMSAMAQETAPPWAGLADHHLDIIPRTD